MRLSYNFPRLYGDVLGGVTSSVMVMPYALGFGVISGLGAAAGLYGCIAVGFFAAVFGGVAPRIATPSGATAIAMAVIVAQRAGNPAEAFTIVMLSGILQIAMGAIRIGRFISYTPYSVNSGFLSGIGVFLIVIQTLPLTGRDTVAGGVVGAVRAWPEVVANVNLDALILGAVALGISIFWPGKIRKFLPEPLVALIVATALALIWFDDAPVIGALPTGLPALQAPQLAPGFLVGALQSALILALIVSIPALVNGAAVAPIINTSQRPNRELVGLGIGNVAAGLVGAIPATGLVGTTLVNIRAGGRSPVSGAVCAAVLLAAVLGFGIVGEYIPVAVLAGILIKVGWGLIDWRFFTRLRHIRRDYIAVMLLTLLLVVFVDLITAIAVGLIASGIARAEESQARELSSVVSVPILDQAFFATDATDDDADDADPFLARVGLVQMRGSFTVASATELTRVISADIRDHQVVIFDFSATAHMDDSAALVMERLVTSAARYHTECIVLNLSGSVQRNLNSLNVFQGLPRDRFVDSTDEARELAKSLLDRRS